MAVTIITGISMVNSIPAVSEMSKGSGSLNGRRLHQDSNKMSFPMSKLLQNENEGVRTDSEDCCFTTYGMDRQLRFSDYRSREYHH